MFGKKKIAELNKQLSALELRVNSLEKTYLEYDQVGKAASPAILYERALKRDGRGVSTEDLIQRMAYDLGYRYKLDFNYSRITRVISDDGTAKCTGCGDGHDFSSRGDGTAKCTGCGEIVDISETGAAR